MESTKSCIGVLLDVSGSMQEQLNIGTNNSRADSAINAISEIIKEESKKHDESELFVAAFGMKEDSIEAFDLLTAVLQWNRDAPHMAQEDIDDVTHQKNCYQLLNNIHRNGASRIFQYVNNQQLAKVVPKEFIQKVLARMNDNKWQDFSKTLPAAVQDGNVAAFAVDAIGLIGVLIAEEIVPKATEESIRKHAKKLAEMTGTENYLREITELFTEIKPRLFSEVSLSIGSKSFAEKFRNHRENIEKKIYGSSPMCRALRNVTNIFSQKQFPNKQLIIISDGVPTDGDPIPIIETMKSKEITISTILLAPQNRHIQNPRAFYDKPDPSWNEAAKLMFQMASVVENQKLPRALLTARHWMLPVGGTSSLFLDAISPDIVNEIAVIFSRLGNNMDILLDMVGQIQLDEILNTDRRALEEETRNAQKGGTCYAHAVSTVLLLASKRVVGYQPSDKLKVQLAGGGLLTFSAVLKMVVKTYGDKGANTKQVLTEYCKMFRFHCREVDEEGARNALNKQRPVVSTFSLYDNQWNVFEHFWHTKREQKRVMKAEDLPTGKSGKGDGGHAVSLISQGKDGLRFLNSWGTNWGDGGFFRVQNGQVLQMTFYDVFFYEEDLTQNEKKAWKKKASEVVQDVEKMFPYSSATLQYICPLCEGSSIIREYEGDMVEAKCPKCLRSFCPAAKDLEILRALYVRDN